MTEPTLFETEETLTVGQLTKRLGETVRRVFPREVWVQGQIRNLSRSGRGHVYFDLVDPVAAGEQPKAAIAVTLFDSNRLIVNRIITRTGNNVRIDDGVEVRIKATVEVYRPRGQLQLNMTSIDPEFTLGRLGADRELLLRVLSDEGLIGANALVPMPLVPLRIALITSHGSAAHADFSEQIAACRYAFAVDVLTTRVQGEFAPDELAEMIIRGAALEIDVIAVVRGGGARTDLAAFDTEPVARAIAASPVPVLCGIGHETDTSVADLVAHTSLKTPTACAQFLIDCVAAFDAGLTERARLVARRATSVAPQRAGELDQRVSLLGRTIALGLASASRVNADAAAGLERRVARTISRREQRLATMQSRLDSVAAHTVERAIQRCDRRQDHLTDRPRRVLRAQRQRLDLLEAKLSAVDPVQALRRGYSITTTAVGRLVLSATALTAGTPIITRLADGSIASTVTEIRPAQREESP